MAVSRKTKILLAILAVLIVAAVALFIHVSRDPLEKFKVSDTVQVGAAEQKYIEHVLDLIGKNDMRHLFKEMINMDAAVFSIFSPKVFSVSRIFVPPESSARPKSVSPVIRTILTFM